MQTRRQLLRRGSAAAAAAVLAPAPLAVAAGAQPGRAPRRFAGGRFAQGVLSGDPTPRGITLWTALADVEGAGSVTLEVARDPGFRHVVARRELATSAARAHTVKARVSRLRPHERYWYRFSTRRSDSPVGRFQTAPAPDSRVPVRFAFYSCADWTHGYYNAYELMAREDDLDFVVCLGDYIYAETSTVAPVAVRADTIGRDVGGVRQAVTLADYRAKYALYRSDPALRALHQRVPLVAIWDDHEVADNYAGGAPAGGLPAELGFDARRGPAYRAFLEHMPLLAPGGGPRIYRSLRFGRNVDLLLLDERQYRGDQPCGGAVNAPDCPERHLPRAFLGESQMRWLERSLDRSRGTWKVIGNQVPIMPVKSGPDRYGVFDTWQGYPQERERLLGHIGRHGVENVVFATGDFHIFAAGDVRPGESADPAATLATEFHSGSITSQSLGEGQAGVIPGANDADPRTDPAVLAFLEGLNPWIDALDIDHHGYGVAVAGPRALEVTFRRMATVKRRSRAQLAPLSWTVPAGRPSIKGQGGRR